MSFWEGGRAGWRGGGSRAGPGRACSADAVWPFARRAAASIPFCFFVYLRQSLGDGRRRGHYSCCKSPLRCLWGRGRIVTLISCLATTGGILAAEARLLRGPDCTHRRAHFGPFFLLVSHHTSAISAGTVSLHTATQLSPRRPHQYPSRRLAHYGSGGSRIGLVCPQDASSDHHYLHHHHTRAPTTPPTAAQTTSASPCRPHPIERYSDFHAHATPAHSCLPCCPQSSYHAHVRQISPLHASRASHAQCPPAGPFITTFTLTQKERGVACPASCACFWESGGSQGEPGGGGRW